MGFTDMKEEQEHVVINPVDALALEEGKLSDSGIKRSHYD